MNDADLLQRYATVGDEDAFASLVGRHLSVVYGAALRQLGNPALAQEVAQSSFVRLARRAAWLTGHPSLAGWLYRTAVHLAQHEARANHRRRRREQIALELGVTMKVDDSLFSKIAPVLDEALLELSAADRAALLLRFFAGKSLREVGAALGVREDAAQKRVAKALDALTERFRRRGFHLAGAAAVALALQQASSSAVPAGLAAPTTQAALGAGAAASLGSLAGPITKLMTLTKLQSVAVCIAVAALPLGYEWNALNQARQAHENFQSRLAALEADALSRERDQTRAELQLADLKSQLNQSAPAQPASSTPAAIHPPANLYLWDENSPYVRVPRQLLSRVQFAPYATRVAADGRPERYQLPPLAADGTPQPALDAALGLSADEADRLQQICQAAFAKFFNLAESHSELNPKPLGNNTSMKLDTAAFADEGNQLRDQFKQQVADLLGTERADAFWQQAAPVFTGLLNDFGNYPRELQLIRNEQAGILELMTSYRNSSSIGQLDAQRNGLVLPPALQAYADTWTREMAMAAQSSQSNQQSK